MIAGYVVEPPRLYDQQFEELISRNEHMAKTDLMAVHHRWLAGQLVSLLISCIKTVLISQGCAFSMTSINLAQQFPVRVPENPDARQLKRKSDKVPM